MPYDPSSWRILNEPEPDDALHDPGRVRRQGGSANVFTLRGLGNLGCLAFIVVAILALFAGYPVISHFTRKHKIVAAPALPANTVNTTWPKPLENVPNLIGYNGLIDVETPQDVYTRPSYNDPTKTLQLVWSDEFNVEGRSFYPGDDPFWEALDFHYWQTGDVEWYDPEAVTTMGGALELTLSRKDTHNLTYQGGMVTTWNKLCFTGGLVETAVTLPGAPSVLGFWPAVWTMGNLGRVGYGATTDGLWPYSYDSCDYGALPNQTLNGKPAAVLEPGAGDKYNGDQFSKLPGQRLSRCTCPGEDHPGPKHADGTYVGRSSPEIDIFEAKVRSTIHGGVSSQTGQVAPFNYNYTWPDDAANYKILSNTTELNTYRGGAYQQAISAISTNNQSCYELTDGCFSVFAFEYKPGFDDSYITWVNNNEVTWKLLSGGLVADPIAQISARPIPQEPLYVIANFGMSDSFVKIDYDHLTFPAKMRIDYVRVYQPSNAINVGCDPEDFPTKAYIDAHPEAYWNAQLTTWEQYGGQSPKNSLLDQC
ncbi:glycoside hydrolase family 16 protein [Amylostereum chailletii]|nr:glycoside hydrolase family 16 protein [Amylostereum chailletii]